MNKAVVLGPIGVFAGAVLLFGNHSNDTTRVDAYARNSQPLPAAQQPVDLYSGPFALDNNPVAQDTTPEVPWTPAPTTKKAKASKSGGSKTPHVNVPNLPNGPVTISGRGHVRVR